MKNVHLITADSVRADAVGFPHAHVETTPYLSDLARESLVFSDAIAPGPRTPSSIPVLLTGTHLPVPDRVPTE